MFNGWATREPFVTQALYDVYRLGQPQGEDIMDDTLTKFKETTTTDAYYTPKQVLIQQYKQMAEDFLGYMDKVTIEDFFTYAEDVKIMADRMNEYSKAYDMLSGVDVTKNSAKDIASKFSPAEMAT